MKPDLRILLLQIRQNTKVREEEYESFIDYSGLNPSQIDIHNVFDQPIFSSAILNNYDALFVGGASEASVLEPKKYTFVPHCCQLLEHCITKQIPVFASCFGFQVATLVLGGEVKKNTETFEMGTLPIQLTQEAKGDILFSDTNNGFPAVSCHQEEVLAFPSGCIPLAFTNTCCHAFRVAQKPFWAFQFHPELDKDRFIERLAIYHEKYTEGENHYQKTIATFFDTPESNGLLKKFVERVLIGNKV